MSLGMINSVACNQEIGTRVACPLWGVLSSSPDFVFPLNGGRR